MSRWLRRYLASGGIGSLVNKGPLDLYIDDPEWRVVLDRHLKVQVEDVITDLVEAMREAQIEAYHGCRTDDVTSYFKHGIRTNDPARLERHLRDLVATVPGLQSYRRTINQRIAEFDARERDTGTLYLSLDDRYLVKHCGHYLLYGSEWVQCILGFGAHEALRQWGAPTVMVVKVPGSSIHEADRRELADWMLREWTRLKTNKLTSVQSIDFAIMLRQDVAPSWVETHYHPEAVRCPFNQGQAFHSPPFKCEACG